MLSINKTLLRPLLLGASEHRLTMAVWVLVQTLVLAGCGSVSPPVVSDSELEAELRHQLMEQSMRHDAYLQVVSDLFWPLRIHNTAICNKKVRNTAGFRWYSPASNVRPKLKKEVLQDRYDHNARPTVTAVVEGSPADDAGMQTGDYIVAIGNLKWSSQNEKAFNRDFPKRLKRQLKEGTLQLGLFRDGEVVEVTVGTVKACAFDLEISQKSALNATTNGREITMYMGLLQRLTEDEIQTVLAHELAHCVLKHIPRTTSRIALGVGLDLAILAYSGVWVGAAMTNVMGRVGSKAIEEEADYVSMYLLANAGLDTANRESIWRKLMSDTEFREDFLPTHPNSAERYILLKKTHEEIQAKQLEDGALLPNGMSRRLAGGS